MSETLCFEWESYWPHTVRDLGAIRATADKDRVSCVACLWALGSQKHNPPAFRPEG